VSGWRVALARHAGAGGGQRVAGGSWPAGPLGQASARSQADAPEPPVDRFEETMRPTIPSGPWATLLRVAWLAILLGLLLQLALLLLAAGFGTAIRPRPLLAETFKTVSWSLLVCVGVALGRVAAKGQVPLEGVTGLLAAPLALTAANAMHKGVAEAVDAAGVPAGPAPLWVLAIKAAEYGCLGLALGWVGRRAWRSALGHLAVGLMTGVAFGGVFLTAMVRSAPTPLSTPSLLARGFNELLFPVGCALVVFIAEVLGTHVDRTTAEHRPVRTGPAEAEKLTPPPSPVGVGSLPDTLTVGPPCNLERGHWACVSHHRNFHTRRSLDHHTRLGAHRLVWLCWAHGPEQPGPRRTDHPDGHRKGTERLPLAKLSQRSHRRSACGQQGTRTRTSSWPALVIPAISGGEGRSNLKVSASRTAAIGV
jgi:hypothetical protein